MSAKAAQPSRPPSRSPLFLVRILIGGVFVVSGFQKLVQPSQNFLYVVQNFEFLPEWAELAASHAFPWAELVGGVFFAFGLWTRPVLWTLWATCTAFVAILGQAIMRNLPIESCGCFGEMIRMPLPVMLGVDVGMWFLFGVLAFSEFHTRRFSLDNRFSS